MATKAKQARKATLAGADPRHRSVARVTTKDRDPPRARERPAAPVDRSVLPVGGFPAAMHEDMAHLSHAEALSMMPGLRAEYDVERAQRVARGAEHFVYTEHGRADRIEAYDAKEKGERKQEWSAEERRDELEVMYGKREPDPPMLGVPRPREAKNPASEVRRMLKDVPVCRAYAKSLVRMRVLQMNWAAMDFAAKPRPLGFTPEGAIHDSFYWYYNWLYHLLVPIEKGAPVPKIERVAWTPEHEHKDVSEHAYTFLRLNAPYRSLNGVRTDKAGHELFDVYPILHRPLFAEYQSLKRLRDKSQ